MKEFARKCIAQFSEKFKPKTEIEQAIERMPKRPIFRYEPKELKKWEAWVDTFLPAYLAAGEEEKKYARTFISPPVAEMIQMFWEDGEDVQVLPELLNGPLMQVQSQLRPTVEVNIPRVKLHHKIGGKQEKRLFKDIIYERIAQKGVHDDASLEIAILKRLVKGEIKKPDDPEYTQKVLERFPGNKKIKKLIMKIQKRSARQRKPQ